MWLFAGTLLPGQDNILESCLDRFQTYSAKQIKIAEDKLKKKKNLFCIVLKGSNY